MQSKRENILQKFPWHVALLSDNTESLISGRMTSYDLNIENNSGFSALHCLIFKLLINNDNSFRASYKSIVLFLHAGFAVDSQCRLGFTPLCMAFLGTVQQSSDFTSSQVIHELINYGIQTHCEYKRPNYSILRDICLILLDSGATLKVNKHRLSPLSYTQLYFHTYPHAQYWLLTNYPRNIDIEELFKLSLLKAVTPEKNYRAILKTAVKHGILFQHQSINCEISLKSIICVLIQINYCIGLEEFCRIYNLPSYHCRAPIDFTSLRGQELEIIGAASYFLNTAYSSRHRGERQYEKFTSWFIRVFDSESMVFLVFTIFIAIWGSRVYKDIDYPYLVDLLSKEFKSESILHLIIATKGRWSKYTFLHSSLRSQYFSEILSLIYDGLWSTLAQLMCNQVNNRDYSYMGYTPLHIAAENNDLETINFLIKRLGAYPYAVSTEGKTFYELLSNRADRHSFAPENKQYMAFIKSLVNQVRPLKTICAIKIIECGIDLKPLIGKSKLCLFVNLHKPRVIC